MKKVLLLCLVECLLLGNVFCVKNEVVSPDEGETLNVEEATGKKKLSSDLDIVRWGVPIGSGVATYLLLNKLSHEEGVGWGGDWVGDDDEIPHRKLVNLLLSLATAGIVDCGVEKIKKWYELSPDAKESKLHIVKWITSGMSGIAAFSLLFKFSYDVSGCVGQKDALNHRMAVNVLLSLATAGTVESFLDKVIEKVNKKENSK